MLRRTIRAVAAGALLGCVATVGVASVGTVPSAQASGTLHEHAAARGKFFGSAVDNNELADTAYAPILRTEFGQLTAGNAMKWDAIEPQPGQFQYGRGDQIVSFARQNGQSVRGHTLVWHNQTPSWVQNLDPTALRAALQNHITNVVTHYRGQLYAWDVVNEPLNEDGTLRNSFWLQKLGPGYIADAFRWARAADPDVKLYINDYNTDGLGAKSDGMFALVQSLRQQGVPIDGVGFQAHLAVQYGFPSQMQQNLQRFANLGLDVAITELDVRMVLPPDPTKINAQATYYRNVTNACLAVARCVGITIWGYTDRYSWIPGVFPGEGYAHPADENFQRKPAYTAVHDALAGGSGDTTPPTTPGTPVATSVTANSVTLNWTVSTDNVGVSAYEVYRALGPSGGSFTMVGTPTTNAFTDTGLSGSTTYRYYVRARDAVPNFSANSAVATVTTPPGAGTGACRVAYRVNNWGGGNGFTASVTITNTGTSPISGWTLAFSFPAGQRLTDAWSANWSQSPGSANVTATNMPWNSTIAPGASVGVGFNATYNGSNPPPTNFALNGSSCTVG